MAKRDRTWLIVICDNIYETKESLDRNQSSLIFYSFSKKRNMVLWPNWIRRMLAEYEIVSSSLARIITYIFIINSIIKIYNKFYSNFQINPPAVL